MTVSDGWQFRAYQWISHALPLAAPTVLRRRLKRGKEDPARWQEKVGEPSLARPNGTLVWLHAVGLGEVLSTRGVIAKMATDRPDLSFLVTSSTAVSAQVFARNLPPRTQHQFLPLDAPKYQQKFLDHWAPDLSIWIEQDIWPGLIAETHRRGVPLAWMNARMDATSFASHKRFAGLYRDTYRRFDIISAQDAQTAGFLRALGAQDVAVAPSLKSISPPMQCDRVELLKLRKQLAGRFVWAVVPAHPADQKVALDAHETLQKTHPNALLIIAPRNPGAAPLANVPHRSRGEGPDGPVWLLDTFGDTGLLYNLSDAALIGGSFDATEGHNPWEAAMSQTAIFHGPHTANFTADYAAMDGCGAAKCIASSDQLSTVLGKDLQGMRTAAAGLVSHYSDAHHTAIGTLITMLGDNHA